jgi:pimeloyl-ACP methyl ester carboxylesterase
MAVAEANAKMMKAGGVEIEVDIRGSGKPLLLLSSEEQLENASALVDDLAKRYQVVIPSAPGFGRSPRPDWMTNPDDIAYIYLDLLEKLGLKDVIVVGFSLGGWIAAEMATKDTRRISRLVMVDAYGVKIGGPFDVDIEDMWILHPQKVAALKWHDVEKGKRDFASMNDGQLTVVAQNMETFARFCWEPYMHNPKLKHRLHRIDVPTLVIWGENDGLTKVSYGKAYAGLIPGAKFETIAAAGHFPHIEQPEAFAKVLNGFIG